MPLIDAMTDQYFPIIESLGESMDDFQQTLLDRPTRERVNELHEFKRLIAQNSPSDLAAARCPEPIDTE